jgi:hypothetical protein
MQPEAALENDLTSNAIARLGYDGNDKNGK